MAVAVDLAVNPANTDQRYVLYSNGIIEARGGAVPVGTQSFFSFNESYQYVAPLFGQDSAVKMQVVDWTTPSGYTLDKWGYIYPWGAAVAVLGQTPPFTGGPEYLFGNLGGISSPVFGYVIDFVMDPSNTGRGYFLTYDGDVHAVGTGVTAIAHLPGWAAPNSARRMQMDWATKRYWVLDTGGRIAAFNGGANPNVGGIIYPAPSVWGRGGRTLEGDMILYDTSTSTTPKGWTMDCFGRVYDVGGAQVPLGAWFDGGLGWAALRVIDSGIGANPLRLVEMNQSGGLWEFVSSTAPSVLAAQPTGTNTTDTHPWIRWVYSDREGDAQASYEVRVIADGVYLVGATNEVQRITITGTPTGGTFTVTFRGVTSAAIARNAPNATVQAVLEAMSSIGTGNVVVSGGVLPGTAVTLTFQGALAAANIPQLTATGSFTGGASPAVAVTTITPGVDRDPTALTNVFTTSGDEPRLDSVRTGVALANDTYRAYVRVTDTAGLVSAWSYTQWDQNVSVPNTPTVTPTAGSGLSGISLALHVTTPGAALFGVQFHDADWDGSTWEWVRGGFDVVPDGSGNATLVDTDARFGVLRSYRAVAYIYTAATDSWRGSAFSTTTTATLGPRNVWTLTNPFDGSQGKVVDVQSFEPARAIKAGQFDAVNRRDPIIVSDGAPRFAHFSLDLWMKTNAMRTGVEAMFDADVVLNLRDPFGRSFFIKAAPGDLTEPMRRAAPTAGELTAIRDFHELHVPVQSVRRPPAGPTFGPFADVS